MSTTKSITKKCEVIGCNRDAFWLNKNPRRRGHFRKTCSMHHGKMLILNNLARMGNRYTNNEGYVIVRLPENNYRGVSEHRHIMEQELGRKLRKGESVHHINGIRDDNRPENLELWVTPPRYGQRASDLECPHCGRKYL